MRITAVLCRHHLCGRHAGPISQRLLCGTCSLLACCVLGGKAATTGWLASISVVSGVAGFDGAHELRDEATCEALY
jgi:hypothetical protein